MVETTSQAIDISPRQMNYPSTTQIKEAFMAVANAEDRLKQAKQALVDLHYASEEVDNSAFLLENIGRRISPAEDAQDVLFARHQKAQEALTTAFKTEPVSTLEQTLKDASTGILIAVRTLHGHKPAGE